MGDRRNELELQMTCAEHPRDVRRHRVEKKHVFFDYRGFRLIARKRCTGGAYGYFVEAIPCYIVLCESGGNYRAVNSSSGAGGAYQVMPATWRAYGGDGLPQNASPREQSRIAELIWVDAGPGAWSCA